MKKSFNKGNNKATLVQSQVNIFQVQDTFVAGIGLKSIRFLNNQVDNLS